MINERTFAELIFTHILQDPRTFCTLAQVSKRFNEVSKTQLIKKERINEDGTKEVWTELPNGTRHGLFREWYPCGQLKYEKNYNQNQLHGLFREWYENGRLKYEYNYVQNQLHGLCREWYENGRLWYEYNYDQDQLHGLFREWYKTGQLKYKKNYK